MNPTPLTYHVILTTGANGIDGSGDSCSSVYATNKPTSEISQLYLLSSKIHDLDLLNQCHEYGDNRFDAEFTAKLANALQPYTEALGVLAKIKRRNHKLNHNQFCDAYLWIVKLVDPTFSWIQVDEDQVVNYIGGYGLHDF